MCDFVHEYVDDFVLYGRWYVDVIYVDDVDDAMLV